MGSAGKKLRTRMDIGKDIQSCLDDLNNMTHELWNSPEAEKVRAKVRCCDRDCWMIGSVSPAMHKYMYFLLKYTDMGAYAVVITTAVIMVAINMVFNPIYAAKCLSINPIFFYKILLKHIIATV